MNTLISSKHKGKKRGFALIMTLVIIVAVSTILGYMVSSSSQTTKKVTNNYLLAQAELLARSATEYALLAISSNDRNTPAVNSCISYINSSYPANAPIFDINTTIKYIGLGALPSNCANYINAIATNESVGTVLIDVYVHTVAGAFEEDISFHKRSLQKP